MRLPMSSGPARTPNSRKGARPMLFAGIDWSDKVLDQVAEGLENRNYKWSANFDQTDIELLNTLLGDLLVDLRYEVK